MLCTSVPLINVKSASGIVPNETAHAIAAIANSNTTYGNSFRAAWGIGVFQGLEKRSGIRVIWASIYDPIALEASTSAILPVRSERIEMLSRKRRRDAKSSFRSKQCNKASGGARMKSLFFCHSEYSLSHLGGLQYRHRGEKSRPSDQFHCPPFGGRSPGLKRCLYRLVPNLIFQCCERVCEVLKTECGVCDFVANTNGGMDETPPECVWTLKT